MREGREGREGREEREGRDEEGSEGGRNRAPPTFECVLELSDCKKLQHSLLHLLQAIVVCVQVSLCPPNV